VISYDGDDWKKHKLKNHRSLIISLFVDAFDNKWICTSNNIIVFNTEGVEFKNNITNENIVIVSK
jgi:streptogramin lyase